MGTIADGFNTAFRDHTISGDPYSGPYNPIKSVIRAIGATIESFIAAADDAAIAAAGVGRWRILEQSSVKIEHTGDTAEHTMKSIIVPPGAIGPNGRVRVTSLWSGTNSGNTKTLRHKFAGTNVFAQNITTQQGWRHESEICNRGVEDSQVTNQNNVFGSLSAEPQTLAVDTASAVTILLTGQLANSGEKVSLETYRVEVLYSA